MPEVRIDQVGQYTIDRVNAVLHSIGKGSAAFQAIGAAMKRASDSAKTQAGRYAAETYNISKGKFMANCNISTKMQGGSGGVTSVELLFAGKVLRLIEFGAKGSKRGGVYAAPKNGGGNIRSAFITAIYGQTGVWERVGRTRFPVEQKYGPSTGHMMQDEGVSEQLTDHIQEVFDSRIEHEITRILNGW
jgi:hypothetical protein